MSPRNYFQGLFNFQRIICEKESEELYMLVLTNFDSFAITYTIIISKLLIKFHFPIEVVLNSWKIQKGLALVLRSQLLSIFFE